MTTDNIGLYLHIPFCVRKCRYCDFASFGGVGAELRAGYIKRLREEILSYSCSDKIKVDTVFFGGGTPSLLSARELESILDAVHKAFRLSSDCELTLEANPGTVDSEKLSAYASLGVNRLSIGLQSIHENELKILGRIHTYDDFLSAYESAHNAGIDNINVDLMYAVPEQTLDSFSETLDAVTALEPAHISAYGLILEEGTDFYNCRDRIAFSDEDTECDMYRIATEKLGAMGYSHYEISNYAKDGYRSRHNLKYWHDSEYVGVGLAAHSYYGKKRYYNTSLMDEYISDEYAKYRKEEVIDKKAEAYEYAMMRLRLSEGFSLADYKMKFDEDFLLGRKAKIEGYEKLGLMKLEDDNLSLTEKGFYLSNTLLSELL